MARISAAGRTVTNLPTAVRGPGIFSGAASGSWWLREVSITNTTTTAVAVGLAICTAKGTQVGTLTVYQEDDFLAPAPGETGGLSQSTDSTVAATIRQTSLGAAIGAGVIWTFGDRGVHIPEGTTNGVIINLPTGTGQHLDFYFVYDK